MRELSKEMFNKIKKYEKYFNTAVNSGYIMALPMSEAMEILEAYVSLGYTAKNLNCHRCVFEMVKTVGQYYIDFNSNNIETPPVEIKNENNIIILEKEKKASKHKKTKKENV